MTKPHDLLQCTATPSPRLDSLLVTMMRCRGSLTDQMVRWTHSPAFTPHLWSTGITRFLVVVRTGTVA